MAGTGWLACSALCPEVAEGLCQCQALASQMGALRGLTTHAGKLSNDLVDRRGALARTAADHATAKSLPLTHLCALLVT